MYHHLSKHKTDGIALRRLIWAVSQMASLLLSQKVLAYAPQHSALTRWSDNVRIFDCMAESAVISQKFPQS